MFAIYIDLCFIYNIFIFPHNESLEEEEGGETVREKRERERQSNVICFLHRFSVSVSGLHFVLASDFDLPCSVAKTLLKLFLFIYRLCVCVLLA